LVQVYKNKTNLRLILQKDDKKAQELKLEIRKLGLYPSF